MVVGLVLYTNRFDIKSFVCGGGRFVFTRIAHNVSAVIEPLFLFVCFCPKQNTQRAPFNVGAAPIVFGGRSGAGVVGYEVCDDGTVVFDRHYYLSLGNTSPLRLETSDKA